MDFAYVEIAVGLLVSSTGIHTFDVQSVDVKNTLNHLKGAVGMKTKARLVRELIFILLMVVVLVASYVFSKSENFRLILYVIVVVCSMDTFSERLFGD